MENCYHQARLNLLDSGFHRNGEVSRKTYEEAFRFTQDVS